MPVQTNDYRIIKGEPKAWRSKSPSGGMTTSRFCGECGGRIHGERDGRPEITVLRAGTLDDTTWLRPAAHMFMRSAQPWEDQLWETEPAATCYDTMPDDFAKVGAAWRVMMADAQS
jgi:hypothetical protein